MKLKNITERCAEKGINEISQKKIIINVFKIITYKITKLQISL